MFIALVVLLILSAFFSIAETSMMALNRFRLRHLVSQGRRGARLTAQLLANMDKLLGVILLGNNLINAAAAALVTVIAVRLLGDNELALTVGTLTVTFFILVFSEITPKVIGATYPEKIALPISYVLTPMLKLAYPVVWFVNLFVKTLLKLLRIGPASDNAGTVMSMEELRTLVMEGGHYIPPKHHNILLNLFELEDITVDDVMAPRNQIEAIDISSPMDVLRETLLTSHHTRLPVYDGRLDNIVGVLHVRTVLNQTRSGQLGRDALREILREPYFVPAGTPLLMQLHNFQENQRHIAMVVDEYGELKGLLTLEDILEEIVGEFTSQSPTQGAMYRIQLDGSVLVEGGCHLRVLNRKLGFKFPMDGPKTINGLVLERLENIPEPGTSLKISGYPVEIVQTQDRMVKVVRIYPERAAA